MLSAVQNLRDVVLTWEPSFPFRRRVNPRVNVYASGPLLSSFPSSFNGNSRRILRRLDPMAYSMYLVLLLPNLSSLCMKVSSLLLFECCYLLSPRLTSFDSCCTSDHASNLLSVYFTSYARDDARTRLLKTPNGDMLPFCCQNMRRTSLGSGVHVSLRRLRGMSM